MDKTIIGFEINLAMGFQDINMIPLECSINIANIAALRTVEHRIVILN